MAKKRKDAEISNSINNIINGDEARIVIERDELMNLTKVAKSWEFTCSFCFKKFASAQALGGHQNAHRNERLEEKRLFVRDPIGYRKRAFLRAIKSDGGSAAAGGGGGGSSYVNHHHAATKMVKTASFNGGGSAKARPSAFLPGGFNDYFLQPWSGKDSSVVDIDGGNAKIVAGFVGKKKSSFPPLKELSLVERVAGGDGDGDDRRRHAEREEGGKGKACIHDFNIGGGYGINLDQKLDLTLKL